MEVNNNIMDTAKDLMEQTQKKKDAANFIDFKMVTFSLAKKDYAIDIMHVKEIAKAGRFTYVPNTLPFVLGVYNLRGEIIPILDLRIFFNIEVPERKDDKLENLLILTLEDQTFGLIVDEIDKVIGVQKSTIQPPHPLFADINIKYLSGVVESNNRLYILLDVERIFSNKEKSDKNEVVSEEEKTMENATNSSVVVETSASQSSFEEDSNLSSQQASSVNELAASDNSQISPNQDSNDEKEAAFISDNSEQEKSFEVASNPSDNSADELKFVAESLKNYKNFFVSNLNEKWVKRRYEEWSSESGKTQIQTLEDANEFLQPFWSVFTGKWWSLDFAKNMMKALPSNSAKQIVVWNPGCGIGLETYCLACVLKEKYPEAKVRIYAQDVDLLSISNASMITVPEELKTTWLRKYLSEKANGELTFNQDIKDMIMFEYHDCRHSNVLPMVDIVFARDILSLMCEEDKNQLLEDFLEKMKGNAIAIFGDNESIPNSIGFGESTIGSIVAYNKD